MRYNPPELLEDYLDSKKHRLEEKKRAMRPQSSRRAGEDSRRTSLSEVSEQSEAESESAEDVIFALFGPRVWDHEGECEGVLKSCYSKVMRQPLLSLCGRVLNFYMLHTSVSFASIQAEIICFEKAKRVGLNVTVFCELHQVCF